MLIFKNKLLLKNRKIIFKDKILYNGLATKLDLFIQKNLYLLLFILKSYILKS